MHPHERRTVHQPAEDLVHHRVGEPFVRAAEHDHVGLLDVHQLDVPEIGLRVAVGEYERALPRMRGAEVAGGGDDRRDDLLVREVEACVAEGSSEVGAGLRGRVGDQAERRPFLSEPADRLHGAGKRLPGHGEHPVDVQQEAVDRHV